MGFMWPYFKNNKTNKKAEKVFRRDIKRLEKKLKSLKGKDNSNAEGKCLEELGFACFEYERFHEAINYWKEALRVYQEVNDRQSMAESYSNIGTACRLLGELREASRFYTRAMKVDQAFQSVKGELKSFHNLGGTLLEMGEWEQALEEFNSALKIATNENETTWKALSLFRIGLVYQVSHQYREAFRFYQEGLRVAESIGDLNIMTQCTFGLGYCYEMAGEYAQSIPCYTDALDGALTLNNSDLAGLIVMAHASLDLHLGLYDDGRNLANKAQEWITGKSSYAVMVEYSLLKARIYGIHGMWEKAVKDLALAEENAEKLHFGYYLARVLLFKAEYELQNSNYDNALNILTTSVKKFPSGKSALIDLERDMVFGKIYRGLDQDDKALQYRESAVLKANTLGIPKYIWFAHHSLGRLYHNKRNFELARKHYETALKWIDRTSSCLNPELRPVFQHQKNLLQVYQDFVILQITTGHKESAARVLKRLNSETLNRKIQHFFK